MTDGESHVSAAGRLGVLLAIFDFPMLRTGIRAIVEAESDMTVVGQVASPDALPGALAACQPDVVVAECLPVGSHGAAAFATIQAIRAARPQARILALDSRGAGEQFSLALKAGADGYLTREAAPDDIVAAVRGVSRGQTYVSPAIVTRMVNTYVLRTAGCPAEDAYELLNEREREVLLLAATGHTNREIARTFQLSEQTIHNYRAGVMEKLGFHDRVELLKYAIRRGIVSVADL